MHGNAAKTKSVEEVQRRSNYTSCNWPFNCQAVFVFLLSLSLDRDFWGTYAKLAPLKGSRVTTDEDNVQQKS